MKQYFVSYRYSDYLGYAHESETIISIPDDVYLLEIDQVEEYVHKQDGLSYDESIINIISMCKL